MGQEEEICRVVSLPHVKDVKTNPNVFRMIREGRIVEVPRHTMNMESVQLHGKSQRHQVGQRDVRIQGELRKMKKD